MTFSAAAAAISSEGILNSNLSISDSVLSKLAASVVVAASAETFASAVAEADGAVHSMASITVPILRFFCPTTFFVVEGLSFFCKSFVISSPRGLSSLIGRDSVINFRISTTSAAGGVEGVSSSTSVTFGLGLQLFFSSQLPPSAQEWIFFSLKYSHPPSPSWQLVCSEH
jgi:hypothetical protein